MWTVLLADEFRAEFSDFDEAVQDGIAAYVELLRREGPLLGRPWADTLKGSKYPNLKELRPTVNKIEWRVAYAFDPERRSVLLVAGAKGGTNEKRFYTQLIRTAERRFEAHLAQLPAGRRR